MPDFGLFCSIWGDTHFEKEMPKIKNYMLKASWRDHNAKSQETGLGELARPDF